MTKRIPRKLKKKRKKLDEHIQKVLESSFVQCMAACEIPVHFIKYSHNQTIKSVITRNIKL